MPDWETRVVGPSANDLARSDKGIRTARILEATGFAISGLSAGLFIAGAVRPEALPFVYEEPFVVIEGIAGVAGLALVLAGWGVYQWNTGAAVKR